MAELKYLPNRKRGRQNIFDERFSASLDYPKLSDRKATVIPTSTLKRAGTDPSEYNLNSSSIRRQCMKQRPLPLPFGSGIFEERIKSKYASYCSLGWQTDRRHNRTQNSE